MRPPPGLRPTGLSLLKFIKSLGRCYIIIFFWRAPACRCMRYGRPSAASLTMRHAPRSGPCIEDWAGFSSPGGGASHMVTSFPSEAAPYTAAKTRLTVGTAIPPKLRLDHVRFEQGQTG